jgi:hypothetical protein
MRRAELQRRLRDLHGVAEQEVSSTLPSLTRMQLHDIRFWPEPDPTAAR